MDDDGRYGQDEQWREINFHARERHAAEVERRGRDDWRAMTTAQLVALCEAMPPCLGRLGLANYLEVRWAREDAAADARERRRGAAA